MANVDRPNGLHPMRYLSGAPYNGAANMYLFAAAEGTATFVGDLVKLAGSAGAAGDIVNGIDVEGIPTISQGTAGTTSVGVVVGLLPDFSNLATVHRAASTLRVALVADDPNLVFEVQEVSGGTALTNVAVGLNADVVVGAGSTTTGSSGMELNNATEAVTSTLNCKIIGLVKRVDNNIGEHAKWMVTVNNHHYGVGVLGV